jgi:taurine dioxygenase
VTCRAEGEIAAAIITVPSDAALGAEIRDLDLSQNLSDEQVAALHTALLDRCVLLFRDQHITDEDQVRFTRYFGAPVEHVRKQRQRRVKEIFIISNVKQNGEPIGALGSELIDFHSDLSYLPKPGTISLLYAVEIPAEGGDTQWCDCRAAYDSLPRQRQDYLRTLRAVHRHYVDEQNPPEPTVHPVVRTHPETGRLSLYVNPHLTSHMDGMPRREGDALLRELYDHMDQPRFTFTHEWQVGDLVMWDNRPTMHRRLAFPQDQRRIMNRTQVFGEEVVE